MYKKIGLVLVLAVLLISCSRKNEKYTNTNINTYTYIEVILKEGREIDKWKNIIRAESDVVAYLEAYRNFCISVKTNKDMYEVYGETNSTPIKFKLLKNKVEDIALSISFATKADKEKEIEDEIFSRENDVSFDEEIYKRNRISELNRINRIKELKADSVKMKELEKFFTIKKDEFSNDNKVWYEPKSAPKYTNRNGIYCYFPTEYGKASNLRFRVQYYSDDWLFFYKIQFSIDGKAYEYRPIDVERDCGNSGYIWEWFDEGIGSSDKELIYALANAKSAKMKFIGKQYYNVKTITQEQILAIKRTLELYNALGGNY